MDAHDHPAWANERRWPEEVDALVARVFEKHRTAIAYRGCACHGRFLVAIVDRSRIERKRTDELFLIDDEEILRLAIFAHVPGSSDEALEHNAQPVVVFAWPH